MAKPGMNTRKPAGMDDFILGTRTPDQNSQSSVGSTSLSLSIVYNIGTGQVLKPLLEPINHSIIGVFHPYNSSYILILSHMLPISLHISTEKRRQRVT